MLHHRGMTSSSIPVSEYTAGGHVTPDQNPLVRQIAGGRIIKMSVGGADNNVYLLQCAATGKALLIDAANDAERIVELVRQECPAGLELVATTHEHIDHWWALPDVVKALSCATAASSAAASELPVTPGRTVASGDTIRIGELPPVTVIEARGHTPGSIILAFTDASGQSHLFTGDSLFPGGLGKTADAAAFASLFADVTTQVFDRYPDNAIVYPGHGDDTTLGDERPHLEDWRSRGW